MTERMVTIAATRVPANVFEAVRASARANDRSISSELRRLIVREYTEPQIKQS
jgi:hypothetical protein